jgi:hypothetical protein
MATLTYRSLLLAREGPGYPNDRVVQSIASGDLRLLTPSNAHVAASNAIVLSVGGNNILSLTQSSVDIAGDVNVLGTVNNVRTSELHVADKVVQLAVGDDPDAPPPERLLDGAGLYVTDPSDAPWQRSLLWRRGLRGTAALLQPDTLPVDEPCWEMRGGGLRLTAMTAGGDVSYGLRINECKELEVYRSWTNAGAGGSGSARVAVFATATSGSAGASSDTRRGFSFHV